MNSGGFLVGEKRGDDKSAHENMSSGPGHLAPPSHSHILPQQPTTDIKTLPTIRPKVNPGSNFSSTHVTSAMSNILPSGLVANTGDGNHGHVATTATTGFISANSRPSVAMPMSMTIPQSSIPVVQLSGGTVTPSVNPSPGSTALPLNVIRSAIQQPIAHHTPTYPSHLPRGAFAAASALSLSKNNSNIAAAATAVLRPSPPTIQIPVSTSILHGSSSVSALQNPLGRGSLISAIKPGTPPSTCSPSPAVNISTPQTHTSDSHRSTFSLHGPTVPVTTPNIQITLQTQRTTAGTEITKPIIAHSQPKPVHMSQPLPLATQSKVIVSQTVTPLLQHPTLAAPAKAAKVTPQRQQTLTQTSTLPLQQPLPDVSRADTANHAHGPPGGSIFIPPPHRAPTTTTPMTTAISIPATVSQNEPRHDRPNIPQLPPFGLTQEHMWSYNQALYPQFVYQQVAQAQAQAQTPLAPMSSGGQVRQGGLSTLIFPRTPVDQPVPSQTPNLTATLQHAMTMASAPVHFASNQMMVQVDPHRHPLSVHGHTAFGQSSANTVGTTAQSLESKPVISLSGSGNLCRTPPPTVMDPSHGVSLSSAATVASSIYTSAANMQSQQPVSSSSAPVTSNPSASPRPSILRKRTSEGAGVVVKKPIGLMSDSHSPRPEPQQPQSNTSSPKTPAGDNSQSSTDTALSSNDATTPTHNSHMEVKIKQEPPDSLENGSSLLANLSSSTVVNSVPPLCVVEASPRKKPRKQLLNATEELKDNTSTDDEMERIPEYKEEKAREGKREVKNEYIDDEGIRWTADKRRPNINLLNFYNMTWKARNNHFNRVADVKPKEERRPTVNELSNQRGIQQKSSGWKLYHMAAQLENLMDLERDMCSRISHLQSVLAPRPPAKHSIIEDHDSLIHELSQANIQRCQLIGDQLEEAKSSMLKLLEHKPRIQEIITKHMSKRPIKKKERT